MVIEFSNRGLQQHFDKLSVTFRGNIFDSQILIKSA